MGGSMSRNKGKRGEREVINAILQPVVNKVCAALSIEPPILQRNTLQSDCGGCDLVGLEWFAPEVKYQETSHLEQWWRQCVAQAKPHQTPVLFHRCNHAKWRVRMFGHLLVNTETFRRVRCPVDIDLGAFVSYFEERLAYELKKENNQCPSR